jgi:acetylornithine deacetylase/succinyl-diaminopimelate desuccinylase-like protein
LRPTRLFLASLSLALWASPALSDPETNASTAELISTADKSSVTLLLTAHGTSTHSSLPRPDNAIFRLSRAMAKLAEYNTPPRLISSTRELFEPCQKPANR